MDCQKYKDTIDSFLCGETLVESNLEMIRHAEHCPKCRAELAARRNLRLQMQRLAGQQKMAASAHDALRAHLRQAAGVTAKPLIEQNAVSHRFWLAKLFNLRTAVLASTFLFLLVGLSWWLTHSPQTTSVQAAVLSPAVFEQAAREHELCAHFYANSPEPKSMASAAVEYDSAYAQLDQIAKVKAQGMQLRAAHKCSLVGRNFAHLLFSRGSELISFMVTERDAAAMREGKVPDDDGKQTPLQHDQQAGCVTSAWQTRHHVVFVVSKLSEAESEKLATQIAQPISQHLRAVETQR